MPQVYHFHLQVDLDSKQVLLDQQATLSIRDMVPDPVRDQGARPAPEHLPEGHQLHLLLLLDGLIPDLLAQSHTADTQLCHSEAIEARCNGL